MIIGIDASRANRKYRTGVENYAFHLIQAIKKSAISPAAAGKSEIRFVLYSEKPLEGELAQLPEDWSSKVLHWPFGRLWTQARLSWEMLVHPPDILFVPSHVAPLIHAKKTVVTIHDIAAVRFPESYSWFQRWYTVWSAKYAARNLWKVIVPSESTKKEIRNLKLEIGELDSIVVIPHGYDTRYREIKEIGEIQKKLEKYNIRKPFLLTVGRLEEKKNTVRIIKACGRLRFQVLGSRFQVILVGSPGHGYEKVRAAIDQSPFKKDIIEASWVSPDDLPYLMNAAEVFVFPSLSEGFGMPMLEAFACGTPVVASRGTTLEAVGGDAAVYADPLDTSDIARAIEHVCSDQSLREEKIRLGFERVKKFSWERCARETLDVLRV